MALAYVALLALHGRDVRPGRRRRERTCGPALRGGRPPSSRVTGSTPACAWLPFPNDFYTVADPATATGRRVDFPAGRLSGVGRRAGLRPERMGGQRRLQPGVDDPHARAGDQPRCEPAWRRSRTWVRRWRRPVRSSSSTPRTGARWPAWSELDAKDADPATRLLIIHPARNLTEGDRYIVALRDLKAADGSAVAPGAGVRIRPRLARRRRAASALRTPPICVPCVAQLRKDGVGTANLFLAWDFTVASTREHHAARPDHARPDVRRAGQGHRAVQGDEGGRRPARPARPGPGRHRHLRRAELPERAAGLAAVGARRGARRPAGAPGGPGRPGQLRVRDPQGGDGVAPGLGRGLRPRPLRFGRRGDGVGRSPVLQRVRLQSSAGRTGSGCRRARWPSGSRSRATWTPSRCWSTTCSRRS